MKVNKFKNMSAEELRKEHAEIQKEIFNLHVQRSIGKTPQTHLFRKLRKDIARILTELKGS